MKRTWLSLLLILFCVPVMGAQHDYDLANNPGAAFRADLNDALEAIATNNVAATAPSVTFADMWWMDSSTNILKQRTHANDGWVNVAQKSGSNWIPYRNGTLIGDGATLTKSTDGTLSGNSDSNVATQKATKTYADTKLSKSTAGEINALTEKTTLVDDDLVIIEDSAASYAKKKAKKSKFGGNTGTQIFTSSGTFVAPAGVNKDVLTMIAGGGGGGSTASGGGSSGGGGGAGAYKFNHLFSVTPGNSYTVTIGTGGNGGTPDDQDGAAGGDTSFDSVTVSGGSGGVADNSGNANGGAGGGTNFDASASVSTASSSGGGGMMKGGNGAKGAGTTGGGGGGSPFGPGASGGNGAVGGNGGANTGAGGGGAGGGSGSAGGNGGSGLVIVEW